MQAFQKISKVNQEAAGEYSFHFENLLLILVPKKIKSELGKKSFQFSFLLRLLGAAYRKTGSLPDFVKELFALKCFN